MNIFYLDEDPVIAAQMQCDKHVVKMILESMQMLSTAHRVLDGRETIRLSKTGRKIKHWIHPNKKFDENLYFATHVNHPCNVWIREGFYNYHWLVHHVDALLKEYTFRYGKEHKSKFLLPFISVSPYNLPPGSTKVKLCMGSHPECINENDPVESYRNFYKTKQTQFKMNWTKRQQYQKMFLK